MKTKAGLGLVVLGIGVFGAWRVWTGTRNMTPLDVPVALGEGQTTSAPFRPNLSGLYWIELTAEDKLPKQTVNCLLSGAEDWVCKDIPSLRGNWVVNNEGREVRSGELGRGQIATEPGQIADVVGEFAGEAGRTYVLHVSMMSDVQALQMAHPRVRVVASSLVRTDFESANVLVFSISFICVMFGTILLALAVARGRRAGARPDH